MRIYEALFIIKPDVPDEEADQRLEALKAHLTGMGATVDKLEKWGKRRTAYDIKKFGDAYYVFFHYEGGTDIPQELNRRFRQMDTVLRHLTLVKETRQNVRKKKKVQKRTPGRETAEEAAAAAVAETQALAEQRKREEA